MNKRIEFVQQQMREEVVHTVNGVAMQMAEMEKRILQEIKEANEGMKRQGSEFTASISEKEKTLSDTIQRGIEGVQKFVYAVTEELHQKRIEVNSKYAKKFTKIKDVIAKYFEKYDLDLEECKINMKVLNQKYADWSKILIEPTSFNEARLYAVETRLHEEEEIRLKEQEFVRELLKKLIFSLEQTNLQNLENFSLQSVK